MSTPLWRRYARFTGPSVKDDIEEELRFHLEMREQELLARGMDPARARAEAERRFGDLSRVRRECAAEGAATERTRRRREWFGSLRQDVGYGLRMLLRAPGFTVVAVLTIALGIGATTAVFSVLNGVLLRPLPYPGSEGLVVPRSVRVETGESWGVTHADYQDWREAGVFESVAVHQPVGRVISGDGEPERLNGVRVTEDFFRVVGVAPALGRHFRPEEFQAGAPGVMVISYELWQRRFGGDRGVVGQQMRLRGEPVEIVGVLPAEMGFPSDSEMWLPMQIAPASLADFQRRDNYNVSAIARLVPGKTLEATRAELAAHARRIAGEFPQTRAGVTISAEPLLDQLVGARVARALWLVLAAVGFVLLIGCVNVANLLLSRASARERELAVRAALGAGGGRLVRQLLTESLLLGVIGGAIGVFLAWAGVRLLVAAAPPGIPRLDAVTLDARVLIFATVASILSAQLFGLVPAFRAAVRRDLSALREGSGRTTTGRRGRRLRDLVIAGELALSLVLLAGAGLLLRSLDNLRNTDPGFQHENVLTFDVSLQGPRYQPDGAALATFGELRRRLEALPGVRQASVISSLPLGGGGLYLGRAFLAEGQPEPPASEEVRAMWMPIGAEALDVLGIRLLQGRRFTDADGADATPVMIVTREFARRIAPDGNALGVRVRSWRDENVYREVVGIVDDVRPFGLEEELTPTVFIPHAQDEWTNMVAVVRTETPPAGLVAGVRGVMREVDPELAISRVQTMEEVLNTSVAPRRFGALLIATFAALALLLASVGVYGVLSYAVARRTREIGVRMALGATRRRVLSMVLGEAGAVVGLGLAMGLAGALLLTRTIAPLLYRVSATDPAVYLVVAGLLATVAFAASWVPAARATRVNPMTSIRTD